MTKIHSFNIRDSTSHSDNWSEMSNTTSQRLVPPLQALVSRQDKLAVPANGSYSPRRSAPSYTRKRDASVMADSQTELISALVPLTQLIEASKTATSPASVDAAQKTLSPPVKDKPKRRRIRKKTERRREQCRNNQARYRNRQRGMVNDLEESVRALRQEIEKLNVQHHTLCYGSQTKQTVWSVAVEYFRLFQYGILVSMQKDDEWGNPPKEFRDQEYFLRSVMAENVAIGELSGVDAVIKQWRRYSTYFGGLHLQLERLEKQPAEVMSASCTLSLTVTESTIRYVFPHLLCSKAANDEGPQSTYSSIGSRVLGKQLGCQYSLRFQWDAAGGRISRMEAKLDLVTPLLRVLGNLEDVNYVLEKAIITPECLLGELQ
ncbi:hypothetical protein PHYBOEH_010689 [Phytophthora boehmeriae]|uniref:BZIP transcription factor 1 n=1 Tax=Phytophthora boehmeriae TaxID=109152 RepID=A0A8T1X4T2_9STRA|nr:hypothetical protein PHYBOEH_010689 [Phytophthora boehmeriae]